MKKVLSGLLMLLAVGLAIGQTPPVPPEALTPTENQLLRLKNKAIESQFALYVYQQAEAAMLAEVEAVKKENGWKPETSFIRERMLFFPPPPEPPKPAPTPNTEPAKKEKP